MFWVVATIFFHGCTLLNIQLGPSMGSLEEIVLSGEGFDKVLIIEIEGMVSNRDKNSSLGSKIDSGMVERVREILQKAEKDNSIKSILLRINSPGGTVTSSDIIFHELKTFKERTGVKIYAILMDVAASGAYYIALAANKIIAHPTSLTGSIGVIAMKVNLKGLMEKVGVGMEVVKSGDKKDFLSPLRPFTNEERQLFQETIDGYHNRFVQLVSENRIGLDRKKAQSLADGRVYNSKQALDNGLIDGIGYIENVIELLKKELRLKKVQLVSYHRKGDYKANVYSTIPQPGIKNLFNLKIFESETPTGPTFMYLWAP